MTSISTQRPTYILFEPIDRLLWHDSCQIIPIRKTLTPVSFSSFNSVSGSDQNLSQPLFPKGNWSDS